MQLETRRAFNVEQGDSTFDFTGEGEKARRFDCWKQQYAQARTTQARWTAIRVIYRHMMPDIIASSAHRRRGRVYPYFEDWQFTDIEERAWQTICSLGAPLYPQVPVARWFVDFANPYVKIGVELDGKNYHDPAKDRIRDATLVALGWRIFRITGAEAYRILPRPDYDGEVASDDHAYLPLYRWWHDTSDGVLTAIDRVFFSPQPATYNQYELMLHTLDAHRIVSFALVRKEDDR